jgi:aspartate/methionine/tyrosine aminotransferase
MTYEIRNIVNVAEKLQKHGVRINWENIGDPIVKGEVIPAWMKEIVAKEVMDNDTWGYCHTRGVLETRQFICDMTNKRHGAQITPEDIIFFNGLGDAIAKIYGCLRAETRVLMPSPPTPPIPFAKPARPCRTGCYRLKAGEGCSRSGRPETMSGATPPSLQS